MPFSFRRGGSPKRLPWFALIPQNAPVPVLAAERHYLQFDGVGDYAVADAVFGGISGDYTIAIKVAGRNEAGSAGSETYYASGGPGTNTDRRDWVRGKTTTAFTGISTSNTTQYDVTGVAFPADATKRVFAIKRVSATTHAKIRIVSASGVEYMNDDTSTVHEIPDHLAVGARVTDAMAPVSGRYGAVKLIGLVLASAQVPDAELTAWLNDDTAIGNITGIDHYWCASDISGATIPARVGTVALALTGPAVGDLVAWAPT